MSMLLGEIIKYCDSCELINYKSERDDGLIIRNIVNDTRKVAENSLFIASHGGNFDSHKNIEKVIEEGAAALIVERRIDLSRVEVPVILTRSSFELTKKLAAPFFAHPSRRLNLLGITGTNGKTTTSYFARSVLAQKYSDCGLIGTIKYIIGCEEQEAPNTSPEPLFFQQMLARMVDYGLKSAVMEVSSHAIKLGRIENTEFDTIIFTNLSKEHTEFHPDMNDYFKTKASLLVKMFDPKVRHYKRFPKTAIVNIDDNYGRILANELKKMNGANVFTFSLRKNSGADMTADVVSIRMNGADFYLNYKKSKIPVELKLTGAFNIYNALAAAAAGACSGLTLYEIKAGLEYLTSVPGRFELVEAPGVDPGFSVFVDFAHTPESFVNVIALARELNPARIITVFGCGGDRSREKRPMMGYNAALASEHTIITSDNPRSEDPMQIINDIIPGAQKSERPFNVIADREEAIGKAVSMAREGDIVLILGKGHEKYQIVGSEKKYFDDCSTALKYLKEIKNPQ